MTRRKNDTDEAVARAECEGLMRDVQTWAQDCLDRIDELSRRSSAVWMQSGGLKRDLFSALASSGDMERYLHECEEEERQAKGESRFDPTDPTVPLADLTREG